MIRAVADRLVSRARPAYIGRHRRSRPRLVGVFRLPPAADETIEIPAVQVAADPCLQSASGPSL